MPSPSSQLPVGTRHKAKPKKPVRSSSWKVTAEQLTAIEKELELLPNLVKTHFKKWTDGARPFQLSCMRAQIMRKDVLLHAATGAGKTGIAAGPHLLPSSEGKVTLVVSPLIALQDEQVSTFQEEFGLKAMAINGTNGGCKPEVMADVIAGKWQIVILSPEMLTSRKFIDGVLRKPAFGSRCLSVFIDEAHCVSHWGASFRKAYGSIGIIRAFLPRNTPIIAVTATLTPQVHQDLVSKLQFNRDDYLFINIGNDRSNVSQVVRAMEHPMNSFRDLDFLVPTTASPLEIQKGFVYSDDVKGGSAIVDYLNGRVNSIYRQHGLIRPYNAAMSKKYRRKLMTLFYEGKVRLLVCTDAAGMGCDIPDVDIVVQWKAPSNLSSWVQHAGRAARAPGRQGLAIMIVEKSAFEINALSESGSTQGRGHGRGGGASRGGRSTATASKHGAAYALAHGQRRGAYGGQYDHITTADESHITLESLREAAGEGLYVYIQMTTCQRRLLQTVFRNEPSDVNPELCCDICNPRLFDHVHPSKPIRTTRQQATKRGSPLELVRTALYGWRRAIKSKYYPQAMWGPQAILDDATCELLSSIGPIDSEESLALRLEASWACWDELGHELYIFLDSLDIPPLPGSKKRAAPISSQLDTSNTAARKRARNSVAISTSTPIAGPSTTVEQPPPRRRSRKKSPSPMVFPPSAYDVFLSQFNRPT